MYVQVIPDTCFPVADDSGWWGKGGVFTAISKRCHAVEEQYELAAKMKGMHMYEQSLFYWYCTGCP